VIGRAGEVVARRSLDFYEAVALRLPGTEQPSRPPELIPTARCSTASTDPVGLPRALEMIDATARQLERAELSPLDRGAAALKSSRSARTGA
jgi:hypothetical protein